MPEDQSKFAGQFAVQMLPNVRTDCEDHTTAIFRAGMRWAAMLCSDLEPDDPVREQVIFWASDHINKEADKLIQIPSIPLPTDSPAPEEEHPRG